MRRRLDATRRNVRQWCGREVQGKGDIRLREAGRWNGRELFGGELIRIGGEQIGFVVGRLRA